MLIEIPQTADMAELVRLTGLCRKVLYRDYINTGKVRILTSPNSGKVKYFVQDVISLMNDYTMRKAV